MRMYCGYVREGRLIDKIEERLGFNSRFIQGDKPPFDHSLHEYGENLQVLIFVGKQRNNFQNYPQDYLDFLQAAKNKNMKIAAIQGEKETLPQNNKGIDRVIRREGNGLWCIEKIVTELKDFLDQN